MVRPTSSSSVATSAVPVITEGEIRAALGCVLASRDFDVPERVGRFLSFVIEEALAGRAERIKAYVIAVEVFGRRADIDVMNDPVVRIEAARLRRELERYYLLEGRNDPLIIDVLKGGYAPSFRWNDSRAVPIAPSIITTTAKSHAWLKRSWLVGSAAALAISSAVALQIIPSPPTVTAPSSPVRPLLVVQPFVNLTGSAEADVFAEELADEVLTQLIPQAEVTVFRSEALGRAPPSTSAAQVRRPIGRWLVLEGMIRAADGRLRITSRLLDGETTAVIWSGIYQADLKARSGFDLETSLAATIAASVSLSVRPSAKRL
jgi:TolB-like protein